MGVSLTVNVKYKPKKTIDGRLDIRKLGCSPLALHVLLMCLHSASGPRGRYGQCCGMSVDFAVSRWSVMYDERPVNCVLRSLNKV